MKRYLVERACLAVILAMPVGCATPNTATAPTPPTAVAPGYFNAADQQMGQVLKGARDFYVSIQTQSENGSLTLSANVKKAFNDFGTALNAAEAVYLAYHKGNATQDAAQSAVNVVQSKQAALPLPGGGQ